MRRGVAGLAHGDRSRAPAGRPDQMGRDLCSISASKSSKEKELAVRICMLFVCLAAMFMTASRAGILLSLFGMVIAFIVFFRRDLPRGLSLLIGVGRSGRRRLVPASIDGRPGRRAHRRRWACRPGTFCGLSIDLADHRRPSVVWHGMGHVCIDISGLSQRRYFNLGRLGHCAQHAARTGRGIGHSTGDDCCVRLARRHCLFFCEGPGVRDARLSRHSPPWPSRSSQICIRRLIFRCRSRAMPSWSLLLVGVGLAQSFETAPSQHLPQTQTSL